MTIVAWCNTEVSQNCYDQCSFVRVLVSENHHLGMGAASMSIGVTGCGNFLRLGLGSDTDQSCVMADRGPVHGIMAFFISAFAATARACEQ